MLTHKQTWSGMHHQMQLRLTRNVCAGPCRRGTTPSSRCWATSPLATTSRPRPSSTPGSWPRRCTLIQDINCPQLSSEYACKEQALTACSCVQRPLLRHLHRHVPGLSRWWLGASAQPSHCSFPGSRPACAPRRPRGSTLSVSDRLLRSCSRSDARHMRIIGPHATASQAPGQQKQAQQADAKRVISGALHCLNFETPRTLNAAGVRPGTGAHLGIRLQRRRGGVRHLAGLDRRAGVPHPAPGRRRQLLGVRGDR